MFKSVVRLYETKQLKKAVKAADTILKKFPDHGETLAMKGLTLNALDKKAEATELVRQGLKMDMKSHVCWHVYGLLYRSERDYREAAKAYLNALRIDKDNQQILRDLALLQVQIRDYDGLEDTRRRLLTVRPNQRNNWIGFALSYHLLGNFSTAVSVLDTYHKTISQSNDDEDDREYENNPPEDRYETSELLLYKNMILEESGAYSEALAHLDDVSDKLVDRIAVLETKARLHAALGQFDSASTLVNKLISINPENQAYHHALHVCTLRQHEVQSPQKSENDGESGGELANGHGLTGLRTTALDRMRGVHCNEDVARLVQVCDSIASKYPFSRTANRVALDIIPNANDNLFLPRADAYVRPFLRKGVPSLFSDLKPLYLDMSKANVLGKLFESYVDCLEKSNAKELPPLIDSASSNGDATNKELTQTFEPPCTLLWVLHYLAQHFDKLGHRDKALDMIERAIAHTPTAIECYLAKARIVKHCGDFKGAMAVLNEARKLDLADRYLNTKCCKYALRADMVDEAETWVALFTRDGDSGGEQALYDMQCMWFELGAAESHLRRGQLPQALKKFTAVDRHFADMIEDQFDFHSYCLRKVTLRAYVRLLRFEDRIRRHPFYSRAAIGLSRCFLKLINSSEKDRLMYVGEHAANIKGYADMPEAERRKAVSKRKKQLARQLQQPNLQQQQKHGAGNSLNANGVDTDGSDGDEGGNTGRSTANSNTNTNSNANTSGNSNAGWMESDGNGIEQVRGLLKDNGAALMNEAMRIVTEMQIHNDHSMETHVFSFHLALKRKKYLQALRAVRRAATIDVDDARTLLISVQLAVEVADVFATSSAISPVAKKVFDLEGGELLSGRESVSAFIQRYLNRNKSRVEKVLAACRARLWLANSKFVGFDDASSVCEDIVSAIDNSKTQGMGPDILSPMFCLRFVDDVTFDGADAGTLGVICGRLRLKFPSATCF